MSRLRLTLGTTAAAMAVLTAATIAQAQGPGRGGFGGFGGFGGMFGRGGGDVYRLLDYKAVQDDIKLTEKQKADLPKAKAEVETIRQEAFASFRGQGGGRQGGQQGAGGQQGGRGPQGNTPQAGGGQQGGRGPQGNAPQAGGGQQGGRGQRGGNAQAGGPGGGFGGPPGGGFGGGPGGGFGGPPGGGFGGGPGGGFGGPPGGGFGGGPGGQGGGRPNFDPTQMQAMMTRMRNNMEVLKKKTDEAYAKVLTKAQINRLYEIDLRRQGPLAAISDTIAPKLGVTDMQKNQLQLGMQQAMQQLQPSAPDRGQMGSIFRNPDGSRPSRDEMRQRMEDPAVKAQMEKMREQGEQFRDKLEAAQLKVVSKVLTKRQKDKFNSMLGKPFDVSLLDAGRGPGGRRGGPPQEENAEESEEETPKAKTSAKSGATKPTAKPKTGR